MLGQVSFIVVDYPVLPGYYLSQSSNRQKMNSEELLFISATTKLSVIFYFSTPSHSKHKSSVGPYFEISGSLKKVNPERNVVRCSN